MVSVKTLWNRWDRQQATRDYIVAENPYRLS